MDCIVSTAKALIDGIVLMHKDKDTSKRLQAEVDELEAVESSSQRPLA
jgi:hypothetical protein